MIRKVFVIVSRLLLPGILLITPYKKFLVLKAAFLSMQKVDVGKDVCVSRGFFSISGSGIRIGEGSHIGTFFKVYDIDRINIGKNALISHDVRIISGTHIIDVERTPVDAQVDIGDNVWIGINVSIVGPCIIGDNCIIGANSYVTGNFGDNLVIAGSPAKAIKEV